MPRLFLALLGFTAEQQALISGWLAEEAALDSAGQVAWMLMPERHADVLIHARPLATAEPAHAPSTTLGGQSGLGQIHRVFWEDSVQESQESEDVARERFLMLLIELTQHTQAHCLSFALAGELIDRFRGGIRGRGVWHVQAQGKLLAVVNYDALSLSIRPQTHFLAALQGSWEQRSSQAVAPQGFIHLGLESAMWEYTRRTQRMLLPRRYEKEEISLRRYPRQSLAALYDEEVALLACLRAKPHSVQSLEQSLGISNAAVRKMLATLYFAGAISSQRQGFWSHLQQRLRPDAGPLFRSTQTTQISTQVELESPSERAGPAFIELKAPFDKKKR